MKASEDGEASVVELLMTSFPNALHCVLNCADNNDCPLHLAAYEGETEFVRMLLRIPNMNVNIRNGARMTPLHCAARMGHIDVARALLEAANIDANLKDGDGYTPLHTALRNRNEELALMLIATPSVDVCDADSDEEHMTPLHHAAERGQNTVVKALLRAPRINVNVASRTGERPLHYAATNGHIDVAKTLLAVPTIDANIAANEGVTPLMCAASDGHTEMVKLLLDVPNVRSNINTIGALGETALHKAVFSNHEDTVEFLLSMQGINVNAANDPGGTALHDAAQKGRLELAELLLEKHINTRHVDGQGRTAADVARENGHNGIVELVRRYEIARPHE